MSDLKSENENKERVPDKAEETTELSGSNSGYSFDSDDNWQKKFYEPIVNKPANTQNESEEGKTCGAIYTPDGAGSGEYHFTPYIKTKIDEKTSQQQTAPAAEPVRGNVKREAPPKKRRNPVAIIITVAAAVLLLSIAISAEIAGLIFLNRRQKTETPVDTEEPEITSAETIDYSNTVINVIDSAESSGIATRVYQRGELMSFVDAVEAVKDSVVEIRTEKVVTGRYGYTQSGAGSGVIISSSGLIMTNNHVIDGATTITVRLTNGKEFEATLKGTDDEQDIAILKIEPGEEELTTALLGNSDNVRTGESIMVIGNPLGTLGGSVSAGIISATKREITTEDGYTMSLLQTDASVNPGNSGGAMFNLYGELIGIVNSKYSDTDVEGLGFAIPINDAWTVAQDLIKYGHVQGKVVLGLKGIEIADETVEYTFTYGIAVVVTSADENCEFKVGDIITYVDGVSVSSVSDVKKVLKTLKAGDKIQVRVTRQVSNGFYTTTRSGYVEAEVYEVTQSGIN